MEIAREIAVIMTESSAETLTAPLAVTAWPSAVSALSITASTTCAMVLWTTPAASAMLPPKVPPAAESAMPVASRSEEVVDEARTSTLPLPATTLLSSISARTVPSISVSATITVAEIDSATEPPEAASVTPSASTSIPVWSCASRITAPSIARTSEPPKIEASTRLPALTRVTTPVPAPEMPTAPPETATPMP